MRLDTILSLNRLVWYLLAAYIILKAQNTVAAGGNRYIFRLKQDAANSSTCEEIQPIIRRCNTLNWPKYQIHIGDLDEHDVNMLSRHPDVMYIEEDDIVYEDTIVFNHTLQNSTTSAFQRRSQLATQTSISNWGLGRISRRSGQNSGEIYEYPSTAGDNVHIYILDTGIDVSHPDLRGRTTFDVNFVSDEGRNDLNGHGTHVAGIAAGTVYGVAKRARLHAVKVLNAQGRGRISDLIQGIMYVANQQPSQSRSHIRIANLSLNAKRSVALDDAAAHAADAGVLLVVAAGNTRADACLSSPIASGRTIAVGAIDHNDRLASFSAFGRCVNVLAPGVDILSIRPNGGTRVASGTSVASPFVAGIAALYLAERQYSNVQALINEIQRQASPISSSLVRNNTPNRVACSLLE